jgi:ABC-2 type transport system ATP-binding protein
MTHVTLKDLYFSYRKTAVFEGINLDFDYGKLYGILGKNGTGKSTLLYTVAGLLFPTSGNVDVNGLNPSGREPSFLEDIFLVPEEFHLPDISIRDFIRIYGPFYPKFAKEDFLSYLEVFGVPAHTLLKMSYGQKKKALISFALASGASLLLMDEPTNGLDIVSKGQFRKAMVGALDDGRTIIISSHQVQDLDHLIDNLVVLDNSRILLKTSMEDIGSKLVFKISNSDEELESAYYSEPALGGHALVLPNQGTIETDVNLELLYKSVLSNPEAIHYALSE